MADRCCDLVQEVFSGVSDTGVNLLDFDFRLSPVVTEFNLTTHPALITGKALLMLLETIQRHDETTIAQSGKPCNADIDADSGGRCWQGLRNVTLRLDRGEPLATRLDYRDIAHLAWHVAAVAVANPAWARKCGR